MSRRTERFAGTCPKSADLLTADHTDEDGSDRGLFSGRIGLHPFQSVKSVVEQNHHSRPPRPDGYRRRGFTLIEIILVLAVVVLLATLLIPGVNSMLRAMSGDEPDRIFWDAVTASRELALTSNRTVLLRFDKEKRQLQWGEGGGAQQKNFPVGIALQFLQTRSSGSSILIGGQLIETQEMPLVRFYADGTCDTFRAQILHPPAAPQLIAIDPWTCASVVEPKK